MPSAEAVAVNVVFKTYNAIVKDADKETGEVNILIPLSTSSVDRDGESIDPIAFKKRLKTFKARPILLSSHDYRDLQKQIGEFTQIKVTPEGLMGKPKYYVNMGNPEADWGFFLASIGMASYSVGFIPFAWDDMEDGDGDKSPKKIYTDVELLEISHVVVPSNRDAAQNMRSVLIAKGAKAPQDLLSAWANAEIVDRTDEPPEIIESEKQEPVTKPEETDEYIRIPVKTEEGKHEGHRIRTIDVSAEKGIKALYCGEDKIVITYLFAKDKEWTMESAQAWVKEHSKEARSISQEELLDELDYCMAMIELVGMADIVKETALKLNATIKRCIGSDIPIEDIKPIEPKMAESQPEPPENKLDVMASLRELYRQYGLK